MSAVLRLGGGLLLLIAANIALGSLRAVFEKEWDKAVFFRGLAKGAVVALSFAAVYCAGLLNPGLVIAEVNGAEIDLAAAVHLILIAGFGYYAVAVLKKLKELLTSKRDKHE